LKERALKSVRSQLSKLKIVFAIFVILVLAQVGLYHILQSHRGDIAEQDAALIGEFAALAQDQARIAAKVERLASLDAPAASFRADTAAIQAEIRSASAEAASWLGRAEEVLLRDGSWRATMERRYASLKQAIEMVENGRRQDALGILAVERSLAGDAPDLFKHAGDTLLARHKESEDTYRMGFLLPLLVTVPSFALLLFIASRLFSGLDRDFRILTRFAGDVEAGRPGRLPKSSLLEEINELSSAFQRMEVELRNRDLLLRQDKAKAEEFSNLLEEQVQLRNRQLAAKNELLSRKNEELEQMLYTFSHDLRTPLVGVQGFAQELQMTVSMLSDELAASGLPASQPKINELLAKDIPGAINYIHSGTARMDSLIQGLLKVSRVGVAPLELQVVDMNEMLKDVTDGLNFQAQTAGAMLLVDPLPSCTCDRAKMEQVFTNLISNAIKYRNPSRASEIRVGASRDRDATIYEIRDNGVGIPADKLRDIFKSFYRQHPDLADGEGLGLTIASRIIDRHGGRLWVESEVNQGSTFKILLPDAVPHG
jgi:signal transduction histidine kinase